MGKVKSAFKCVFQLVKGAPDAQLRSLHIQRDPTAYTYIKVGGQIKVLHHVQIKRDHYGWYCSCNIIQKTLFGFYRYHKGSQDLLWDLWKIKSLQGQSQIIVQGI